MIQKRLCLKLDVKLNFSEYIIITQKKIITTMDLLRKPQPTLPKPSLLTLYKKFIRSQFNYVDVTYYQTFNPNKAGLFESIFFWGRKGEEWSIWPPLDISRRTNLISI